MSLPTGMQLPTRLSLTRARGAGGASASEQLLTLATAAGAQVLWNADDPDTWTLREDAGTQFYAATADGLTTLPDLTQATAAKQPDQATLSTGARTWARSGIGTRLMSSTTFTAISQPHTIIVAARYGDAAAVQSVFDNQEVGTKRNIIRVADDGGIFKFAMWGGTFLYGDAADTEWHFFQCNFNGASSELYIDGVLSASGSAGTNGLDGARIMSKTTVGADQMLAGGKMGFLGVFPDLKTNADLADLRAVVEDRYPLGVSE